MRTPINGYRIKSFFSAIVEFIRGFFNSSTLPIILLGLLSILLLGAFFLSAKAVKKTDPQLQVNSTFDQRLDNAESNLNTIDTDIRMLQAKQADMDVKSDDLDKRLCTLQKQYATLTKTKFSPTATCK